MGSWTYKAVIEKPRPEVFSWFDDKHAKNFRLLDHILEVSRWKTGGNQGPIPEGMLVWRVKFGNKLIQYIAELQRDRPNWTIKWDSNDGNGGNLAFAEDETDPTHTVITVALTYPGPDMITLEPAPAPAPAPGVGGTARIIMMRIFPPPP
jgi:uncharacterized membrane protein